MVIQLDVVFIVKAFFVRSLLIEIANDANVVVIFLVLMIIPIMYSISLAQLLLAAYINTKFSFVLLASSFVKVSIYGIVWVTLCAYRQTLQLILIHWFYDLKFAFVVSSLLSLQTALSTTLLLTSFSRPILIDRR